MEGTYLNTKATYDKPPANNILLGEKAFLPRSGTSQGCPLSLLLLSVIASPWQSEKK